MSRTWVAVGVRGNWSVEDLAKPNGENIVADCGNDPWSESNARKIAKAQDEITALRARIAELEPKAAALRGQLHDEIAANTAFRERGGALPFEDMPTFCERVLREREELRAKLAEQVQVSAKLASERACEIVRADNAEKELDHARGIVRACERDYKAQLADAKAKLAACERQEPVAVCVAVNEWTTEPRYVYPADDRNPPAGTKLYANPLALREPSYEECELICSAYNSQSGITHMGARMFNAVREVMT